MDEHEHLSIAHVTAIGALQAAAPGIWPQIWALFTQYAWPIVSQVLMALLPVVISGKFPDTATLLKWVEAALLAVAGGKPIPTFPTA